MKTFEFTYEDDQEAETPEPEIAEPETPVEN